MQSPAGVLLRTLVMLACIVAIPLAALFGSSLPKMVTTVLEGHWPLSGAGGGSQQAGEEEGAAQPAVIPEGEALPASPAEPPQSPWQGGPSKGPSNCSIATELPPAAIAPATYETAVGPAAGHPNPTATAGALASVASSDVNSLAAVPPLSGYPESAAVDQFSQIRRQFRESGATYYLLETWGNQRELYRFYCEVPVGGNPNFTRHFEATHAEPLQAMAQVLREIEAWRAGRP